MSKARIIPFRKRAKIAQNTRRLTVIEALADNARRRWVLNNLIGNGQITKPEDIVFRCAELDMELEIIAAEYGL